MQQILKDNFSSKINEGLNHFVVPEHAGTSVLRGGLKLAKDPSLIKSRRMEKSYGIKTYVPWNADYPKEKHHVLKNGRIVAKDCFSMFVQKGQEVETDEEVSHVVKMNSPDQKV